MYIQLYVGDISGCQMSCAEYDPHLDDVRRLLADVCDQLQEWRIVRFDIGGFGTSVWHLDVGTDLLVFLEQLPDAVVAIRQQVPEFVIDLYEQGPERKLIFRLSGTSYCIECVSYSVASDPWRPNPSVERLDVPTVYRMLNRIYGTFIALVKKVAPECAEHPWFEKWSFEFKEDGG